MCELGEQDKGRETTLNLLVLPWARDSARTLPFRLMSCSQAALATVVPSRRGEPARTLSGSQRPQRHTGQGHPGRHLGKRLVVSLCLCLCSRFRAGGLGPRVQSNMGQRGFISFLLAVPVSHSVLSPTRGRGGEGRRGKGKRSEHSTGWLPPA